MIRDSGQLLGKSMICKKKDELTKKRRTQHIQQYMSKIRGELISSYQHSDYVQLRDLINDLFAEQQSSLIIQENNKPTQSSQNPTTTQQKLWQLICFANNPKHSTIAIVAIAELLHFKLITIDMIQNCQRVYRWEQSKKDDNGGSGEERKAKQIMGIINLPPSDGNNSYGWLVLIRVLITLGYCTQQMITYCLRVIIQSKSPNQLNLSLQILHILVIQKNLLPIEQLYKLTLIKSSCVQKQQPLRTQQLIYALMNHSLDRYVAKQHAQIRYYATKLLSLSFRNSHILQQIILKLIPLNRLAQHIRQKFLISTCYDKKKALQLLTDMIICLTNYNHYHPMEIITTMLPTVTYVMQYTRILSQQIDANAMLGEKHHNNNKNNKSQQQQIIDSNFVLLEQALFLIEILVEQYVFGYALTIGTVIQLLESFMLEIVLVNLHSAYSKQLKLQLHLLRINQQQQLQYDDDDRGQSNNNEGYSEYDLRRIVFVEKVTQLAAKMISHLVNLSSQIRQGNLPTTTKQQADKFLLLRNLIISRFRKSELQIITERQLNQAGIDLNYI